MRRYGETQVVYFGDDPRVTGFSLTQLIATSLYLSTICRRIVRHLPGRV
jgi:hypothetical protein